jgi:hypothetical protein
MWEPRHLTTLWAFTACYRNSFYLYLLVLTDSRYITSKDSWEKRFSINFVSPKFSSKNWNLHYFWRRHSVKSMRTDLWHALTIMEDGQNRWFYTHCILQQMYTPSYALQGLQPSAHFYCPSCGGGGIFNGFSTPLKLPTAIFHFVFRRCSITIHIQHCSQIVFGPFLSFVRNLVMDWCSNPTDSMLTFR